ncbi:MAG: hypothetical protein ACOYLB_12095 [Phototrophicaceae bacterium]
MLMIVLRVLSFLLGLYITYFTLRSIIEVLVVPRAIRNHLFMQWAWFVNGLFELRIKLMKNPTFEQKDHILAFGSPLVMISMTFVWLVLILIGYAFLYYGLGVETLWLAFLTSGSELLTLGSVSLEESIPLVLLMFSEAMVGMVTVALIIAYLPTIYAAFSQREHLVTKLEVGAGNPPSSATLLNRIFRINGGVNNLEEIKATFHQFWMDWEDWFTSINESHTSLLALAFFRSPKPQHSWVTAAGVVLDAAALMNAVVDLPHDARADLCIRAGYVALRDICDSIGLPYNPAPSSTDPISVTRAEFDSVCELLEKGNIPLKQDRDQAWQAYRGWRVNYDQPLIHLARTMVAPPAMWVTDRQLPNTGSTPS